jgi:hypothetical protein
MSDFIDDFEDFSGDELFQSSGAGPTKAVPEEEQIPVKTEKARPQDHTINAEDYPTAGLSWKDLHGDSSLGESGRAGNIDDLNSVESGQLSPRQLAKN